MKRAVLHALAHNVADSLGSGCSLLTGVYELDLFEELRGSSGDEIVVNLLTGELRAVEPSVLLRQAAHRAPLALSHLCERLGCGLDQFNYAAVRFWQDVSPLSPRWGANNRFDVAIEDRRGRRSMQEYSGWPGKRIKVLDPLGRPRPKPPLIDGEINF